MSEDFEPTSHENFSSFWPLLIVLIGLLIWSGYQVYATNSQRRVYDQQFQNAMPTIQEAQNVSTRYVALMKDLVETSAKDPAAAQQAINQGQTFQGNLKQLAVRIYQDSQKNGGDQGLKDLLARQQITYNAQPAGEEPAQSVPASK